MKPGVQARLASVGILGLVLVTGVLLGVAWERTAGEGSADEAPPTALAGSGGESEADEEKDGGREDRKDRDRGGRELIVHQVGIDSVQEERVDSIVDLHRHRIRALRREMESAFDPRFRELRLEMEAEYDPRARQIMLETRSAIRSLLTPEQAVRYDSLLAEHDRKEEARARR